jgi:hypothetical protein
MPLAVSPTLTDLYTKLRVLVVNVVPVGVEVIQGLDNNVPMPPASPGFVAMTAVLMHPHRTPVQTFDMNNPNPNALSIEQGMTVVVQLDCYGALSADWAAMLATLLRTEYACTLLAPHAPLFAKDPMQAALVNAEAQYEKRWIVEANLQYNPVVSTPAEFADTLEVNTINVDVSYPP